MDFEDQLFILLNIVISSTLSGIVGFEREHAEKPAGFRTNMIIGGASCLFVSMCPPLIKFVEDSVETEIITADPIRAIHAIVVGISFIGAGTILKLSQKNEIHYLTTAATLLYSSGIGIAVALELYVLAVGITLLILAVNFVIKYLK